MEDVDLSSFPLLRIDQIPRHETQTLIESEERLTAFESEESMQSISPFVSKLITHIRKEIVTRKGSVAKQVGSGAFGVRDSFSGSSNSILATPLSPSSVSSKRQNRRSLRRERLIPSASSSKRVPAVGHCNPESAASHGRREKGQHDQPQNSQQPSFFVSSSPTSKSSSFRARAKHAKASLQARSDEATFQQREQERRERTRQALETMQDWRLDRERSKKRRDELLEEERARRRQQWKEKREREKQVRSSMHAAAEEAKSMALQSGCTQEEAIVEAATAAARVVNDESTVFDPGDTDSEEGSLADDCTVDERLASKLSFDDEVQVLSHEDVGDKDSSGPGQMFEGSILKSQYETGASVQETETETETETYQVNQGNDVAVILTPRPHSRRADDGSEEIAVNHGDTDCTQNETISEDPDVETISSVEQVMEVEETSPASSCSSGDCTSLRDHKTPEALTPSIDENDEDSAATHLKHIEGPPSPPSVSPLNENTIPTNASIQSQGCDEAPSDIASKTQTERNLCEPKVNGILREEAKPTKSRANRIFCNIFSSFSEIFTRLVNTQRQKLTSDVRQRELSNSMQHQIGQYTRMSKSLRDSTSHWGEDDSSDTSCTSFDDGLFYQINSRRPEVASIISLSFSHRALSSWSELPPNVEDASWNLMWVWGLPKASDFENLLVFQKINRFRNTRGLTRKDLLKKNIQRCSGASKKDADSFNIMPLTYVLPQEFNSFVSGYQSMQKISGNKSSNFWIIKPVGMSRGRGISLVNNISDVSYSQPIVIQRYISDPLCFMGFKFDLRLYVLVTSFSPLEAFLYKEGLGRFGSRQYTTRPEFLHDNRVHLTNSSIQREFNDDVVDRSHPAYLAGSNGAGNKVAFTWLWKRLEGLGVDTKALWLQIIDVCLKALTSIRDVPYQPNSFEIFGFDVMFDRNLKCWLIEVNSSPSLGCDSLLDTRIKGALVRETIALVDPPAFDRKALADVCQRRTTHRKSASYVTCQDILEKDLASILRDKPPRKIGEKPKRMGNFEQIAPTPTLH